MNQNLIKKTSKVQQSQPNLNLIRKPIDFPRRFEKFPVRSLKKLINLSFKEDLGKAGDITTQFTIGKLKENKLARIIAKEEGIVCGVEIIRRVYSKLDFWLKIRLLKKDGDKVVPGEIIAEIEGRASSITKGERIALNFLGLLSGIATKVNRLASLIKDYHTLLLDTRKTIPGLRELQKYAVCIGGGYNHRIGLYDMILIKDNHIAACGGIKNAVEKARLRYPIGMIEVETASLSDVKEALETSTDIVMLDNMDNKTVQEALKLLAGQNKYTEVSGNVDEKRLVELAKIGVDFVSMGALTHTVKPLDISLLIEKNI